MEFHLRNLKRRLGNSSGEAVLSMPKKALVKRANARPKLGLVGYFGWGNFGDELFLEAHHQYLGQDFDLTVANDLTVAPYFSRPVQELVDEVDGFVIGGGDLVNPVAVSSLYWREEYLQKPTFVYGIGVPSTKRRKKEAIIAYRKFMNHPNCKLVVARDRESYEWLRDNLQLGDKLHWYPDPVCALSRPAPKPQGDGKTLGVVMREHRSLNENMEHLKKMIAEARNNGYQIKHLVLATKELGSLDLARAQTLVEEGDELIHSESLHDLMSEIGACSMLATIKFHGMVVATMYGIPSIAMSVTPKNRNFLKMIERSEMLASYLSPELYKRVSFYPARIPNAVRYQLQRDAKKGYALLSKSIKSEL